MPPEHQLPLRARIEHLDERRWVGQRITVNPRAPHEPWLVVQGQQGRSLIVVQHGPQAFQLVLVQAARNFTRSRTVHQNHLPAPIMDTNRLTKGSAWKNLMHYPRIIMVAGGYP